MHISVMPGQTVKLSAQGSRDPDGNSFHTTWFIYREPGRCPAEAKILTTHGMETTLVIPQVENSLQIHILLQLQDTGNSPLMAYHRAVVEVNSRIKVIRPF